MGPELGVLTSEDSVRCERTFESIQVGDVARIQRVFSADMVESFAALSGDRNPLHLNEGFARQRQMPKPVVHGMLVSSLVSALIGMDLPGPGALWTQQSFRWPAPVFIGDTVSVVLRIVHKSEASRTVKVQVEATDQHGRKVMEGEGVVLMTERQREREDQANAENVVLVTGGSRGIGAAIVRAFAAQGASVAVAFHRRADLAESLCHEVSGKRGRALPVELDVCDEASVGAAVEKAGKDFNRPVDILINNAGMACQPKPFPELSWRDIEEVVNVQLRGTFQCSQAVLPGMLQRNSGSIVNIGSTFTEGVPPAEWTAYVLAKSALKGLTRSLAAEYGPKGIRVNMVSPGMSGTDSTFHVSDRSKKVQAMQTPLRRLCTPEDVADAVVFLCSSKGAFLTGLDVPVCGGMRM